MFTYIWVYMHQQLQSLTSLDNHLDNNNRVQHVILWYHAGSITDQLDLRTHSLAVLYLML